MFYRQSGDEKDRAGGPAMTTIVVNSKTPYVSEPDQGPQAQGPYRALLAAADTFARESHIDELAYSAGADPVAFRLGLLDDERLAAVIKAAARRFGWQFPWCPAGGPALWAKGWLRRGAGIAVGLDAGRRVATCVEVRPGGIAQVRVTRVVTAYECDLPELGVVLADHPDLSSAGAGETPLTALAPAIANAIFAATGRRLHSPLPIPDGRAVPVWEEFGPLVPGRWSGAGVLASWAVFSPGPPAGRQGPGSARAGRPGRRSSPSSAG
jgi:CO/xanthine dehydrogenase Mo-binding subunit